MGKDEEEKEKFTFLSSCFDAVTIAAGSEVEMAASGGPERTGYGYGDVATDDATTKEAPPADAHASVVRVVKEWAAMVDDPAIWPTEATDTAPTDDVKAPAKDDAEEEAADRTAGGDGLFDALAAGPTEEVEQAALEAKLLRDSDCSDPTTQPTMPPQDTMKQEKNKGKERELAYSSFSAKKDE